MKAVTYAIKHDIKGLACTISTVLADIQSRCFICENTIFEIKVILNELIVNAICHGNNCECDKGAYVTVKTFKDYVYISVQDEGNGFEYKKADISMDKNIQSKNDEFCEHGRGLIIVEQLCDKLKFNCYGNRVSVIKSIRPS